MSVAAPVTPSPTVPRHVAIIMDGNGRWAQARGLPRVEGHRQGVENVRRIMRAAREQGLRYLTLYAFSCENWKRPLEEVSALMGLLERYLESQAAELHQNRVRLHTVGGIEELPAPVQRLLREIKAATAAYDDHHLVLALNYGSRTEVVKAAQAWQRAVAAGRADPGALDWSQFRGYLDTAELPDPDLIIRTSGEFRVSNFLLLQGAYAEFVFSPKYWPEFGAEDLAAAVAEYSRRERRFGQTREQLRGKA